MKSKKYYRASAEGYHYTVEEYQAIRVARRDLIAAERERRAARDALHRRQEDPVGVRTAMEGYRVIRYAQHVAAVAKKKVCAAERDYRAAVNGPVARRLLAKEMGGYLLERIQQGSFLERILLPEKPEAP